MCPREKGLLSWWEHPAHHQVKRSYHWPKDGLEMVCRNVILLVRRMGSG
jgi:hypothetical protein